jgi:hypothetical protein
MSTHHPLPPVNSGDIGGNHIPEGTNPLHEFVKALARRQARLDASPPQAANANHDDLIAVRQQ